jgi:hypothetical protein
MTRAKITALCIAFALTFASCATAKANPDEVSLSAAVREATALSEKKGKQE